MPSQGLLGCQGPVLVHNFHCLESPAQVQQGSGNLGWVRVEQASRATCTAGVPQVAASAATQQTGHEFPQSCRQRIFCDQSLWAKSATELNVEANQVEQGQVGKDS